MSSINEAGATQEAAPTLAALANEDRLLLSSGQVVTSLAVAVKELVENALDAGATLIEVKFKEQGLGGIEVIDNGTGINPDNFANLTARHATSKLRNFKDLETVETFGFRGEALNSLCALANIAIITRDSEALSATRLEFDHKGAIKKRMPSHGNRGTRVKLTNLFATLPVRKREFQKSIKKEYAKALDMLTGYCLVARSARIDVSNTVRSSVSIPVMSTNLNSTTIDNIRSIFGKKQVDQLVEIKKPVLEGAEAERLKLYEIEGWVSDCHHGSGNSSKSRQFFYINYRPCENKEIMKFINEIYRKFNHNQYPFIFLNISIDRKFVDINVTPDKRLLFVNDEKLLKQAIEKSLTATYESMQQMFKMKTVKAFFNITQTQTGKAKPTEPPDENNDEEEDQMEVVEGKPGQYGRQLSQWKATGSTDESFSPEKRHKRRLDDEIKVRTEHIRKIQEILRPNGNSQKRDSEDQGGEPKRHKNDSNDSYESFSEGILTPTKSDSATFKITITSPGKKAPEEIIKTIDCSVPSKRRGSLLTEVGDPLIPTPPDETVTPHVTTDVEEPVKAASGSSPLKKLNAKLQLLEKKLHAHPSTPPKLQPKLNRKPNTIQRRPPKSIKTSSIPVTDNIHNYHQTISTSIAGIKRFRLLAEDSREAEENTDKVGGGKFSSRVNSVNAEEELSREITKDMFLEMKIVGQFNLGFILVTLGDDLFIIDQHASDEKYNYEDLNKNTLIQSQQLVHPQKLELTATDEMILIDHLAVFEKNGFKFKIDHDGIVTQRVQLVAKPISKNWEFGKEDIDELIHMIQSAVDLGRIRPSRVCAMFASRACRKSVMIGDPLKTTDMRKIVDHLSTLDQPWNCPHGRPTMRHVINLRTFQEQFDLLEEL